MSFILSDVWKNFHHYKVFDKVVHPGIFMLGGAFGSQVACELHKVHSGSRAVPDRMSCVAKPPIRFWDSENFA
jgi:hypothetical protein